MNIEANIAPAFTCPVSKCNRNIAVMGRDILSAVIIKQKITLVGVLMPQAGCPNSECVVRAGVLQSDNIRLGEWVSENVGDDRITTIEPLIEPLIVSQVVESTE